MKFSLIHPSRSRPPKAMNTFFKWSQRALEKWNVEYIISLDYDDPTHSYYMNWIMKSELDPNSSVGPIIFVRDFHKNAVEAINHGAKEATGDILIVISDDTDCPTHWDKILTEAIGQSKDFVMKVADGIQKRIITMPIMDRAYFNRDGHIYDPAFRHSWADTWLTELAHKRGRVITRPDIKFPHDHYSVIGEKPDDLYQRNDKTHDEDRHIYQQKLKLIHTIA